MTAGIHENPGCHEPHVCGDEPEGQPSFATKHRFTSTSVETQLPGHDSSFLGRPKGAVWRGTAIDSNSRFAPYSARKKSTKRDCQPLQRLAVRGTGSSRYSQRDRSANSLEPPRPVLKGGFGLDSDLFAYFECAARDYLESHGDPLSPFVTPTPGAYCPACPVLRRCIAGLEYVAVVAYPRPERRSS